MERLWAEEILNLLKVAKTDQEFYDLGDCCDQLWKKHQANDKLNPWSGSFYLIVRNFVIVFQNKKMAKIGKKNTIVL